MFSVSHDIYLLIDSYFLTHVKKSKPEDGPAAVVVRGALRSSVLQ